MLIALKAVGLIAYLLVALTTSLLLFSHYATNYLGFLGGSFGFFFEHFLYYLPGGKKRRVQFVKSLVNEPILLWEGSTDIRVLGRSGKIWKYSAVRRKDAYSQFTDDWLMNSAEFWVYFLIVPLVWPLCYIKSLRKPVQNFRILGLPPGFVLHT